MSTLRQHALELLLVRDPDSKAARTRALSIDAPAGSALALPEPPALPGRPDAPRLVEPSALKPRAREHSRRPRGAGPCVAHIELNAIDLALDATWRFAGLPDAFYRDWLRVAREEALHFALLRDHLAGLGLRLWRLPGA